jgi:hypothetical protein
MDHETMPPCDHYVFRYGKSLYAIDSWDCGAGGIEQWVKALAEASGQKVDWHYSGGRAHVLYVGDRAAILKAAEQLPCPGRILATFDDGQGLYRNFGD